jgi:teichuronic acid biosynthesis glycosyltransferase TuaG
MNDLVSIIMPSYNSSAFIHDTIVSCLNQSYSNFELIIVDDKSTDHTVDIIKSFKDNRILLIQLEKNLGPSNARNIALDNSKGYYVAFLDSDDIWLKDKLKIQINFMKSNNYGFTFHPTFFLSNNGKVIGSSLFNVTKIHFNRFLRNTSITTSSVIINSSLIHSTRFPIKHRTGEDYFFWLKILTKVKYAYSLKSKLAFYRKHKKSLSSNRQKTYIKLFIIQTKDFSIPKVNAFFNILFYLFNAVIKHYILKR